VWVNFGNLKDTLLSVVDAFSRKCPNNGRKLLVVLIEKCLGIEIESDEVRRQECASLDLICHLPLLHQPVHVYNLLRETSAFGPEQLDRMRGVLSGGGGMVSTSGVGVKRILALVDSVSQCEGDRKQKEEE